jgi:hypothetical protein
VDFVANVHGNVHANYFIGDGSLLTGVVTDGGGGASNLQEVTDLGNVTSNVVQFTNTDTSLVASGDIEAKNIQLNDPSITTTFASGMLTIDAANKTYGTGSLITLTQNMTDLSYSNLIEGSQVIIPITSSIGNYTVSNTMSNVDYHVYSDVATISAGNQGLMTVSNLNGNVYMNMLPFQDLPTGSGGGGSSGYVSGDLTVTGGLTITDLDVTASVTGNVITLDGGNRTFGVSPLLDVSSNVEHLVYSNLIHGSEIKVLMNAFTVFEVASNISNVNRYFYSNAVSVTAGDIALMTFSNLHGSIYADLKISYGPSVVVVATGGTVTEVGGYRIHTFTSSGDFTVTSGGEVEYLIVAGGGGGGNREDYGWYSAAGGGAGGYLENTMTLTAATYPIVVGGGGAGATVVFTNGVNGSYSSFNSIAAIGGGGGAGLIDGSSPGSGGSGGGTALQASASGGSGTVGQGNDGGVPGSTTPEMAGGGGGAGSVGGTGTTTKSGNGGTGKYSTISGTSVGRAGGGGGGGGSYSSTIIPPGSGTEGGGTGGVYDGAHGENGTINTGGGGGGGAGESGVTTPDNHGGNGGSGIVIIRYAI